MTVDMSQFFQVFFDESEELLAEKERLLLAIDVANPVQDDIDAIFRAAHSIKGGAATFGLADMTEVTHILESLLDRIRKGEMRLTAEHVDAFFAAKDVLKMQLDGHRDGAPVDQAAVAAVCARLRAWSDGISPTPAVAAVARHVPAAAVAAAQAEAAPAPVPTLQSLPPGMKCYALTLPPVPDKDVESLAEELGLLGSVARSSANGRTVFRLETAEKLDDILAICSFVIDPDDLEVREEGASPVAAPPAAAVDVAAPAAVPEPEQELMAEDGSFGLFLPLPTRPEAPAARQAKDAKPAAAATAHETSIRVSVEKVDQLINLVGELVITQSIIEQRTNALDPMLHEKLLNSVNQLTRNTRHLQEAVMSIRMMPMDYVFSRFPRMVRDLASKLNKKVDFVTVGAATELDKGLIERIIDPLNHLVRNSLDHGLETPEARLAAGKPETGTLTLSAAHQSGNIVIEVIDDGAGLSRERILKKAREQNLPVSDSMADEEVWKLIFAPGFSTAEVVTDVSGRGVGMDVVRRNITNMGGFIDIRSVKGVGTTISISLPLTLAILDGMSIRVGEEIYILPLSYVIESLQPQPDQVKHVAGQGTLIKVRGDYMPLIPLHALFAVEPRSTNPCEGIVIILESDGKRAALFIDELMGQQQVVVKNLESNYRKVAGISGATILGDGGVSLILDVAALLRSSSQVSMQMA